ncbi:helix-turn-helix domain-containing protein [Lacticaseibacillus zhaodongensis]|uniref:helix-turn-helix domain-containing protein n=1 Tax=Lacticaseibacillus zhaodongensis TaxID=2668065 RepID=UPI0012D2A174|nr:helix-turn-helix transcriptional regulator [Lacticaseibacillus zhaodongensis]
MLNWELIEDYKIRHGYTWQEMSKLSGLGYATLYSWREQHCMAPRISRVDKLAAFMGVELSNLWIREEKGERV